LNCLPSLLFKLVAFVLLITLKKISSLLLLEQIKKLKKSQKQKGFDCMSGWVRDPNSKHLN